jgi:benzoyl-CoA reductase/2-hydroxyglutaryl-CoA dehydratase subunit BcrC/BadD/HgdB
MDKIGFITTVPVEVIFAAKHIPVDINNLFMANSSSASMISAAENFGFPRNYCSWIKGTYQTIIDNGIKKIIVVGEGECSASFKQSELLRAQGVKCVPFSYPASRSYNDMYSEIEKLMKVFSVSHNDIDVMLPTIHRIRCKLKKLDEMSYKSFSIPSIDNFLWLISSTDFNGSLETFENNLDAYLKKAVFFEGTFLKYIKLGLIGIPPIVNNLFNVIESLNGVVIYNEIPRQFSMPSFDKGLVGQYTSFTYPYDIQLRLEDINENIVKRKLDGIIHYSQSFCPRQLDEITLKNELKIPFLTIECDRPGMLDERNIMRLEAFLERWK